ncbi:MAG: hypothetical protein KIS61_29265 [Candidatus Eremiobacteraeota bacterium]|nr:hypothetical protein [Candidatus Eremiobacteraeota bacterium]
MNKMFLENQKSKEGQPRPVMLRAQELIAQSVLPGSRLLDRAAKPQRAGETAKSWIQNLQQIKKMEEQ